MVAAEGRVVVVVSSRPRRHAVDLDLFRAYHTETKMNETNEAAEVPSFARTRFYREFPMMHNSRFTTIVVAGLLVCGRLAATANSASDQPQVDFKSKPGEVAITVGGAPFATYFYKDKKTTRPYFAHVRTPGGIQVTRNHPPRKRDAQDHATYHPGIWLTFGDISGHDYWRLKAKTVHDKFVEPPKGGAGQGSFAVRNRYLTTNGKGTVCTETCRYTIHVRPNGYLLQWDSTFTSDTGDFYFGDQEEMGLGVRVTTPIAVNQKKGGRILDSKGRVNGRQVWGKQADWCDYSGTIDGKHLGITLMPHPKNFRRCWNHARDYGFTAVNPFGRNAFTRGKKSKVVVRKGQPFRLRFGVFVHAAKSAGDYDPNAALADYRRIAK